MSKGESKKAKEGGRARGGVRQCNREHRLHFGPSTWLTLYTGLSCGTDESRESG